MDTAQVLPGALAKFAEEVAQIYQVETPGVVLPMYAVAAGAIGCLLYTSDAADE